MIDTAQRSQGLEAAYAANEQYDNLKELEQLRLDHVRLVPRSSNQVTYKTAKIREYSEAIVRVKKEFEAFDIIVGSMIGRGIVGSAEDPYLSGQALPRLTIY